MSGITGVGMGVGVRLGRGVRVAVGSGVPVGGEVGTGVKVSVGGGVFVGAPVGVGAIVGGGIGLLLAWAAITMGGDPTGGLLPIFHLPPRDLILGTALVLILGVGTGLLPAMQASRLKIVDALRRN